MKKTLIFSLIFILLFYPIFAKAPLTKNSGFINQESSTNPITGNIVFENKPNDVQKIYMKSIPAVVKIIVYVDFDRYLPNIEYVDWDDYNRKIERGFEPTYDDVDVDYDSSTNYYDVLEDEWGEDYGADVRDFPYSTGSGFIINPEGYILTNAHVLAISKEETKEFLKSYYTDDVYYYMEDSYAYDPEYTTDDYLDDWALLNFMYEKLEIRNLKIKTKVIVGVDKPGQDLVYKEYTPKIIDYEGGSIDLETGMYDYKNLDWALLKIGGSNHPSLVLGDSNMPSIGSQLIVVGYPFVSEEYSEEEEYDFKINIEPTLTTGYVSQITSMEKNKYFQVDLSISEGNSGGPALDLDGNIMGIVTLGLEQYAGGHYNYVSRINDIQERIKDKVQPMQGESDQLWISGLEAYWDGRYQESKENIENLLSIYPSHPYAKSILKTVNSKVGTEKIELKEQPRVEEVEEILSEPEVKDNGFSPAMILISVIGIIIIVLLAMILLKKEKIKRKHSKR